MPNPKKRQSPSRRDKRRANWKIVLPGLSSCPQCNAPRLPHTVCSSCGFYNGQLVKPPHVKKKEKEQPEAK